MKKFENKVVMITGGAASIGVAITTAFHNAGATVVIAARTESKGKTIEKKLGENVLFIQTDISFDASLKNWFKII